MNSSPSVLWESGHPEHIYVSRFTLRCYFLAIRCQEHISRILCEASLTPKGRNPPCPGRDRLPKDCVSPTRNLTPIPGHNKDSLSPLLIIAWMGFCFQSSCSIFSPKRLVFLLTPETLNKQCQGKIKKALGGNQRLC